MSFWDWVKQRLFGTPPARDVSRLAPESDRVDEKIDMSGAPLKPHHRRRALRDPRLLPKARAPLGKRPKHMKVREADRLFSRSQRTSNRKIRDLVSDVAQLERLGLPLWQSEEEVANALGLTLSSLHGYACHREKDHHLHYVAFAIPKANGEERIILAPKRRLKAIQRKLLTLLVEKFPLSSAVHGFRKGRNTLTNAQPHVGRAVVVRFDLQDFFPSCTWYRLRGFLIACGYAYPVATCLALLMTECERQPVETPEGLAWVPLRARYCVQGAPTSPGITNALLYKLDRRLSGLARKLGFEYTRYADDLSFSSPSGERLGLLLRAVRAIVEEEGFRLHPDKTSIQRKGRCQRVTGVVVNQVAGLSRQERRRLRAALHQSGGNPDGTLRGKLAYLQGLNPEQRARLSKT